MIEIEESGAVFGPFAEDSLYQIENSKYLPSNVKPVEFAWVPPVGNSLLLLEAKSSFSRPGNQSDFDKNVQEIYTKVVDSLTVLSSAKLGRHPDIANELPMKLTQINWGDVNIFIRFVIPEFKLSWLQPISDELRKRLKHFLASLGIPEMNFQVINREVAIKQRLIKDDAEDE